MTKCPLTGWLSKHKTTKELQKLRPACACFSAPFKAQIGAEIAPMSPEMGGENCTVLCTTRFPYLPQLVLVCPGEESDTKGSGTSQDKPKRLEPPRLP